MSIFGTNLRDGLSISYSFNYDGVDTNWGDYLYKLAPFSNSGDTINDSREISQLDVTFIDIDGSIFGSLGNGTSLNKQLYLDVNIGGTYSNILSGLDYTYGLIGSSGANVLRSHTGNVVNVSRSNNLTSISSQSKMSRIENLRFLNPVNNIDPAQLGSFYGSYAFLDVSSSLILNSKYFSYDGKMNENEEFDAIGILIDEDFDISTIASLYAGTGIYDTTGTGIEDFLNGSFIFVNDEFYRTYDLIKVKGTYMFHYEGTFNFDNDADNINARTLGFSDTIDAGSHLISGTIYDVNKIRLDFEKPVDASKNRILYIQPISLNGDPVGVLRHLLFGKMVSNVYSETDDMGSTFGTSQIFLANQSFEGTIDIFNDYPSDFIKYITETNNGLFYVDSNNDFQFKIQSPYDLTTTIPEYGSYEILESSFDNNINDYFNKLILRYDYDYTNKVYKRAAYGTTSDWSSSNEILREIENKLIKNKNQASSTVTRILNKVKNTLPEVTITTSLAMSGNDIGDLFSIRDPDTFNGTKIVEVIAFNRDYDDSRKIEFRCFDGESLYRNRGYGFWEDSAIGAAVSGTSTSGLSNGTIGGVEGTVLNINESLYGSNYRFW